MGAQFKEHISWYAQAWSWLLVKRYYLSLVWWIVRTVHSFSGVDLYTQCAGTKSGDYDADELKKLIINNFVNQVFTLDQLIVADVAGVTLKFQVIELTVVDANSLSGSANSLEGIVVSTHGFLQRGCFLFSSLQKIKNQQHGAFWWKNLMFYLSRPLLHQLG